MNNKYLILSVMLSVVEASHPLYSQRVDASTTLSMTDSPNDTNSIN